MPRTATKKVQRNARKIKSTIVTVADQSSSRFRDAGMAALIARNLGYVGVCASLNAQAVASTPIRLYAKKRGGPSKMTRARKRWLLDPHGAGRKSAVYAGKAEDFEEVTEHPAVELIRDPNAGQQGYEFWELAAKQRQLCGNSFYHPIIDGESVQLHNMFPQWMRIEASKEEGNEGMVGAYWFGRDRTIERRFEPDEVLHEMHARSPHNPYWGIGPLHIMFTSHDLRTTMDQYETSFFDNMARPDYHVDFESTVTDDEVRRVEAQLKSKLGGIGNAGKFLVTAGVKITQLGWPLKDLNNIEGRRKTESDIAAAFGVPESFIRLNDANLASSQTGYASYCKLTVLPLVQKHAEWMTEFVLPLFGLVPGEYWYACDNPVPEDLALMIQQSREDSLAGLIKINEARAIRDLDPDPHGDELRVNGVPLSILSMPPVAPLPFGGAPRAEEETEPKVVRLALIGESDEDKPSGTAVDGNNVGAEPDRVDKGGGRASADVPAVADARDGGLGRADNNEDAAAGHIRDDYDVPGAGGCCGAVPHRDAKSFDPYANPELASAYESVMLEQRNAILDAMLNNPSGYAKSAPLVVRKEGAIDPEVQRLMKLWGISSYEEWTRRMREATQAQIDAMVISAARAGADQIERMTGETYRVDVANVRGSQWAKNNTAAYLDGLESINKTTAQAIADALSDGILKGEGIASLRGRVASAFDAETPGGDPISRYRANMIARTETNRAQSNGVLAGWKETGAVIGKQWLLSPDACEFCEQVGADYADKTIPLDESFYDQGESLTGTMGGVLSLAFDQTQAPPLHPHCKCALVPVTRSRVNA